MIFSVTRLTTSALVIAAMFTIACVFDGSGIGASYQHRFAGCFTGSAWGGVVLYLKEGSGRLLVGELTIDAGVLQGKYVLDGAEKSDTVASLTAHKPGESTGMKVILVMTGSTAYRTITLQAGSEPPTGPLQEKKLSVCTS